jgi:hypothetical protein
VIPRLRTIALLMLAAGLSLGVFAAKALSTWHLPFAAEARSASPIIEDRVRFYQRTYRLDDSAADLVRRELLRYERHVMDKMWEIRREKSPWFEWAAKAANTRLDHVLGTGTIPSPGLGLADDPDKRRDQESKETKEEANGR